MRVAVIRFPGSNCDLDVITALKTIHGIDPELVWHEDAGISRDYDALILPGGFSFGDYLRAGAIAARSKAITAVNDAAERGKPVLGICNGFQILVEAGLLPGALLRNSTLKFVCKWVSIRVENNSTPFTRTLKKGQVLRMPIAHGEGHYYVPPSALGRLERSGMIAFRYCDPSGKVTKESNPTGTLSNIAGVCNKQGNVLGLMPHPERASERILSPFASNEASLIFTALLAQEEAA